MLPSGSVSRDNVKNRGEWQHRASLDFFFNSDSIRPAPPPDAAPTTSPKKPANAAPSAPPLNDALAAWKGYVNQHSKSALLRGFSVIKGRHKAKGTNARVAFSADALCQAQLFYVASAGGSFFALSSVKAFSRDALDSNIADGHLTLQPRQRINEDLSKLFPAKKADHGEDEVIDADGSDSSSDDAAEPQLDIPDAHLGEHRTKTIFSSYVVSYLPFVTSTRLKLQMNQHFSRVYPQLSQTLSYTKINRIRSLLAEVGSKEPGCLELEACTVALAFNYFDRLVLKNVVDKSNRRAVAGACLLLAIKISDDFFVSSKNFQAAITASHDDAKRICQISNSRHVSHEPGYEIDPRIVPPFTRRSLNEAVRCIERVMKVGRGCVVDLEWPAFVALEFELSVSKQKIWPHIRKILEVSARRATLRLI